MEDSASPYLDKLFMFNHHSEIKLSEIPATWSASQKLMQSAPEIYRTTTKCMF